MDEKSLAKIKSALIDHEVALDKDALWSAIKKTERRRIVPMHLILGIGMLLIMGLCGYQLYNSDQEVHSNSNEHQVIGKNYIAEKPSEDKNVIPVKEKIQSSKSEPESTTTKTIISEKVNNSIQKNDGHRKHNHVSTTQNKKSESNSIYSPTSTENKLYNSSAAKEIKLVNHNNSTSLKTEDRSINNFYPVPPLIVKGFQNDPFISEMTLELETAPSNKSVECYDHRKKHDNWRIEFFGTLDYIDNNMSASDATNIEYLERRSASQTQLEGYRAGIRLKHLFRNGLFIKSGIEGGWIRDRLYHETKDTVTRILANQLLETYMQGDSTIYVYGDKAQDVILTESAKVYNTFRSINIPLLVGYEFNFKKLFLALEIGGLYNIYHDFEGHLLDQSTLAPTEASSFFKDKTSLSVTGGIQLGLELTDQMRFFSMLSFKRNLSEVNVLSVNPIKQLHGNYGVGIGLEFKL